VNSESRHVDELNVLRGELMIEVHNAGKRTVALTELLQKELAAARRLNAIEERARNLYLLKPLRIGEKKQSAKNAKKK